MVVMSSYTPWLEEAAARSSDVHLKPPTQPTHTIINSIAMVKASLEVVQPAIMSPSAARRLY